MPRWRRKAAVPVPVPAWVGTFVPADWDEPDETEQKMIAGCPSMRPWPDHVHAWHARRRWRTAAYAWLDDHPEHDHRLAELFAGLGADPADFG